MRTVTPILCILAAFPAFTSTASANGLMFKADPSTAQAVPTPGPGLITSANIKAKFDNALTNVEVDLKVNGGANVVGAHFHCARPGVAGPIAFGLFEPGPLAYDGSRAKGVLTNADFTGADCGSIIGRPVNNIAALAFAMHDGLIYINLHTTENLVGEIRAQMR